MAMSLKVHRPLRAFAMILATTVAALGLIACEAKRCSGAPEPGEADKTIGTPHIAATALDMSAGARPKPPPGKPCPPKKGAGEQDTMRGAKGTKVISQTLYNGSVGSYKYRIDVENPAPGKRPGSLHVQLGGRGSTHYEYDARSKTFKTRSGAPLPRKVRDDIDNDPKARQMIKRGLRILGEG
jgi:hypothetical protein